MFPRLELTSMRVSASIATNIIWVRVRLLWLLAPPLVVWAVPEPLGRSATLGGEPTFGCSSFKSMMTWSMIGTRSCTGEAIMEHQLGERIAARRPAPFYYSASSEHLIVSKVTDDSPVRPPGKFGGRVRGLLDI